MTTEPRRQRALWCYAIASKRYALFTWSPDGRPVIVGDDHHRKRSEHGLGHLLAPVGGDPRTARRRYIDRFWEHLLCIELGIEDPVPDFLATASPAIGRLTVTTPREEAAFRAYNHGRPYEQRVRPFNFLAMAHPHWLACNTGGPSCLVAPFPFTTDPEESLQAAWYDRGDASGRSYRIRVGHPEHVNTAAVLVQSHHDIFDSYRAHPEGKLAAADGTPSQPTTTGELQPRHVSATRIVRLGKETNRLAQDSELADDPEDLAIEYPERHCSSCGAVVAGRRKWCSEICRMRARRGGSVGGPVLNATRLLKALTPRNSALNRAKTGRSDGTPLLKH